MFPSDSAAHHTPSQTLLAVLHELAHPLTVVQLAQRLELRSDACSRRLARLQHQGLVRCCNDDARVGRVYALTRRGQELLGVAAPDPAMDWALFGWVSFRHRSAVLLALDTPLQPAAIKRRARYQDPNVRLSANNVRDVIQLFLARGIVRAVHDRKRAHPRYELTDTGARLQHHLLLAQTRSTVRR